MCVCPINFAHSVGLSSSECVFLPGSNVSGSYNRLARAPEETSQVEALIAAGLNVIRELHNYNIGHGVAKLKEIVCHYQV